MTWHDLLPLALFVAVATATPGGATTLATASGASFGYRRSLPYIGGIALGLASMAASSAAGLGSLMTAFPSIQIAMKTAGSIYLFWLAWRIAHSGSPHRQTNTAKPIGLLGGAWLLWHNPKGWAMTLSASASFATLAEGPLQLGTLLGVTFGIAAIISLSLWCIAGLALARLFHTESQWRLFNLALALLLVASIVPMWTSNVSAMWESGSIRFR